MKNYILFPLLVIVAFLAVAPVTHASMRYRSSYSQQYYYNDGFYDPYGCGCDTRDINYGYMPYSVGPYMNGGYYNAYNSYSAYSYGGGYSQPYYYGGTPSYGSFAGGFVGGLLGSLIGSGQHGYSQQYYAPTYNSYDPYINSGTGYQYYNTASGF